MSYNNQKELLLEILNNLNDNNINYCILRNYENLPDEIGHDIDFLLNESNKEQFNEIIIKVSNKKGWNISYIRNRYKFRTIVFYKIINHQFITLKFDVWTEMAWRGISWVDTNYILSTTRIYKNFYVPRKGVEAAVTVLKEFTGGGLIPEKYYEKVYKFAKEDKSGFQKCLESKLGNLTDKVYELVIDKKWAELNLMRKTFKKKVLYSVHDLGRLDGFFKFIKFNLNNIIRNKSSDNGGIIAFVGPDGSGKSTVIENVNNLIEAIIPERHIYHMRFGIFPEIKTGFGLTAIKRSTSQSKSNTKKDNSIKTSILIKKLINKAALWAVIFYYTLEFILGHFKVNIVTKRKGIILFDRYYYDYFVQPLYRDFISNHKKWLLSVIPKPKAIIYLQANPETVFERKGELSVKEIFLQDKYFLKTLNTVNNFYIINTDNKLLNEVNAEACQIIMEALKL